MTNEEKKAVAEKLVNQAMEVIDLIELYANNDIYEAARELIDDELHQVLPNSWYETRLILARKLFKKGE